MSFFSVPLCLCGKYQKAVRALWTTQKDLLRVLRACRFGHPQGCCGELSKTEAAS
jgi:hypothetical protein